MFNSEITSFVTIIQNSLFFMEYNKSNIRAWENVFYIDSKLKLSD